MTLSRATIFSGLAGLILACGVTAGEAEGRPEPGATVVPVREMHPLDITVPPSEYNQHDGSEAWRTAWARAAAPASRPGGGFFDFSALVTEGFRSAHKFHAEYFVDGEKGTQLEKAVAADMAVREGTKIKLTGMRIVYFMTPAPVVAPPAQNGGIEKKKHDPKQRKPIEIAARKDKARPQAPNQIMPEAGRVVITAPESIIDTATNEGRASGNVTIEIFTRPPGNKTEQRVATLASAHLNWRTWSDSSSGSTEMVLYTVPDSPTGPHPVVTGDFVLTHPDGTVSRVKIEGRGLIFEKGMYENASAQYDELGNEAGKNKTVRTRALFHSNIRMETTASLGLVPFQKPDPLAAKDPAKPPEVQMDTILACNGPAILDLAAVPNQKKDTDVQQKVLLGRRFEFLNGVQVERVPAKGVAIPAGATPTESKVICKHLYLKYAPGAMPGASTMPECAEALGGVSIKGANAVAAAPGQTSPFEIYCQRLYFDGSNENIYLTGDALRPVQVKSDKGDATAPQFCYQSRTQTLTMVAPKGDNARQTKRLLIRAGAMESMAPKAAVTPEKPKAESLVNLSAGDTIVAWHGGFSRELVRLPVPHQPDRVKEILTLYDEVSIEQPAGGLLLRGEKIKLVRTMPTGDVEFLEGVGGVDVTLGELKAKGDNVYVELEFGKEGEPLKNLITVGGTQEGPAILFMGGSAIRARKFVIDRKTDTFSSYGGAVAVVKSAEPVAAPAPKPQAAKDASGLFKGISFSAGGNLFVQCDGDFSQQGGRVTIKKNVIVRQPGLQLFADEVVLILDQPAPTEKTTAPAVTPSGALFAGKLKAVECQGKVEIVTPDQIVQCDKLTYDEPNNVSLLEVDDPDNDVRVYAREDNGDTKFLSVKKSLRLDGKTGAFLPGGQLLIFPLREDWVSSRNKESSPARPKAIRKPLQREDD